MLAATALALVVAAAGCGGDDGDDGTPERASGPVAALWVIDHGGAEPPEGALAPYEAPFERILAGCSIDEEALGDRILHVADEATRGSGTIVSNLDALRAVARRVGDDRQDCTGLFVQVEALLGGAGTSYAG